jgi:uncharacterized protein YjiS (DUF1127 family)
MVALARALVGEQNVVAVLFEKAADTMATWNKRAQMRRELAELTFRDILDIGLDQADIESEIAKPFWRA